MSSLPERISGLQQPSIHVGIFQDNLESINWHYHDYYEISFITEGTGKRFVADSMDEFFPGDLVFVAPNIPHTWVVEKEQVTTNVRKLEMVYLQFTETTLSKDMLVLSEFTNAATALKLSESGIRVTGKTLDEASNMLLQMPYSNSFNRYILFLELLDLIGKSNDLIPLASKDYINKRFHSDNKRIQTIHEYFMKHYRDEIDLTQIASLVSMAEGSLCRFFKMQMGMTIFEYLNKIKVDFACKLLMNKEISITEVAYDSGFNNLSHFNKQFKSFTGVTPKAYRKKYNDIC
jgi:AraC-like DNA-binding protein